jgi:hypothetical protein
LPRHVDKDPPIARVGCSIHEFAVSIGTSDASVLRAIRLGKIRAIRLGRRLIIPLSEQPRLMATATGDKHE